MQIKINPSDSEKGSGSTSLITWENPYLLSALNTAFAVRNNERIASLEISSEGITARFESSLPAGGNNAENYSRNYSAK